MTIVKNKAFGIEEVVGGGMGAALANGLRRGLFSNEAGLGSAPNVAATADVSHPDKSGYYSVTICIYRYDCCM
ncbi:alanine:cation symporter family protein [Vibrio sp. M60_M31a]